MVKPILPPSRVVKYKGVLVCQDDFPNGQRSRFKIFLFLPQGRDVPLILRAKKGTVTSDHAF
jgi:hypothetical protein